MSTRRRDKQTTSRKDRLTQEAENLRKQAQEFPVETSFGPQSWNSFHRLQLGPGESIPEPSTWVMMILGIGVMAYRRKPAALSAA
jgi:hypothetical protein